MKKYILILATSLSLLLTSSSGAQDVNNLSAPYYFKTTIESVEVLFESLIRYHVDNIDNKELLEVVIEAIVEHIKKEDPYIAYIKPEETTAYLDSSMGKYAGIGARVNKEEDSNFLSIDSFLPGSPAKESNIIVGDIIKKVNGESLEKLSLMESINKIKGPEGSSVNLEIERNGEILTIPVTRKKLIIESVRGFILEDNITYIHVMGFNDNTVEQLEVKINELNTETTKGLILDLRYNPGGLLGEAIEFVDLFTDEGMIVQVKDKNDIVVQQFNANVGKIINNDLPLIIIINKYSASASELVADSIRKLRMPNTLIVGTISYGKGSVQRMLSLPTGGIVKFTVARYYPSSGNTPDGIGVTPDVYIELPDGYIKQEKEEIDIQMQAAINSIRAINRVQTIINPLKN